MIGPALPPRVYYTKRHAFVVSGAQREIERHRRCGLSWLEYVAPLMRCREHTDRLNAVQWSDPLC